MCTHMRVQGCSQGSQGGTRRGSVFAAMQGAARGARGACTRPGCGYTWNKCARCALHRGGCARCIASPVHTPCALHGPRAQHCIARAHARCIAGACTGRCIDRARAACVARPVQTALHQPHACNVSCTARARCTVHRATCARRIALWVHMHGAARCLCTMQFTPNSPCTRPHIDHARARCIFGPMHGACCLCTLHRIDRACAHCIFHPIHGARCTKLPLPAARARTTHRVPLARCIPALSCPCTVR